MTVPELIRQELRAAGPIPQRVEARVWPAQARQVLNNATCLSSTSNTRHRNSYSEDTEQGIPKNG